MSDAFRDALVFRAGRQVQLYATFECDGLRFPADWHGRGRSLFLSVEVLPHREAPYPLDARALAAAPRPDRTRLVPYAGFSIEHRGAEAIAEAEDHVFYLGDDVRGVEAIAEGRTRAECARRMRVLLAGLDVRGLVGRAYDGPVVRRTALVEVRRSTIAGAGVHARRALPAGTVVATIDRPLVTAAEVPGPGDDGYGHCIQVQPGWWQLLRPSPFYYWNHSCAPNTRVEFLGPVARIVAARAIRPGEELTGDYATVIYRDDPFAFECGCGSRRCRGVVRGRRRRPSR